MSKIRKFFESRYPNGQIINTDFSQLEIVVLAFLSKDKQLRQDILDGIDLHNVSASWVTGKDYEYITKMVKAGDPKWIEIRRKAKTPRFQLQYGAGPYNIALSNGWKKSKAKEYIDKYYARYPGVKKWQEDNIKLVKAFSVPTEVKDEKGLPVRKSYHNCEYTKRRYHLKGYNQTDWMGKSTGNHFVPSQIKNYPVQGLATADIVPMIVGELFWTLNNSELSDTLLVNTVHDNIILDTTQEELDEAIVLVYNVMNDSNDYIKKWFDFDFDLPLNFKIEVGPNWLETREVNMEDYICR